MTDDKIPPAVPSRQKEKRRGILNPAKVRAVAFYVITLCVIISVVVCILAIWDFAKQDALWRTVATCVVIAAGCAVFSAINVIFGSSED